MQGCKTGVKKVQGVQGSTNVQSGYKVGTRHVQRCRHEAHISHVQGCKAGMIEVQGV